MDAKGAYKTVPVDAFGRWWTCVECGSRTFRTYEWLADAEERVAATCPECFEEGKLIMEREDCDDA